MTARSEPPIDHAPKTRALLAYSEELLSPQGRRRLEAHLVTCDACQRELAAMTLYEGLLEEEAAQESPEIDFGRMERRLGREARRLSGDWSTESQLAGSAPPPARRWARPAAVIVGALAVAAGVALFMGSGPGDGHGGAQDSGAQDGGDRTAARTPSSERDRLAARPDRTTEPTSEPEADVAAEVTLVAGAVFQGLSGERSPVALGDRIAADTALGVGESSALHLFLGGRSFAAFEEESAARLDHRLASTAAISLRSGAVNVAVERRDVARRDVERGDVERRDVERRDVERRDVERRDVERRDVERGDPGTVDGFSHVARVVVLAAEHRAASAAARFTVRYLEGRGEGPNPLGVLVWEGSVTITRPDGEQVLVTAPARWRSDGEAWPGEPRGFAEARRVLGEGTREVTLATEGVVRWEVDGTEVSASGPVSVRLRDGAERVRAWDARGRAFRAMIPAGPGPVAIAMDDLEPEAPRVREGHLSSEQIGGVVQRGQRRLRGCYELALRRGTTVYGAARLRVTVGHLGQVRRATLLDVDGAGAGELKSCVENVVRQWTFPPPGGELTFVAPLSLAPTMR